METLTVGAIVVGVLALKAVIVLGVAYGVWRLAFRRERRV